MNDGYLLDIIDDIGYEKIVKEVENNIEIQESQKSLNIKLNINDNEFKPIYLIIDKKTKENVHAKVDYDWFKLRNFYSETTDANKFLIQNGEAVSKKKFCNINYLSIIFNMNTIENMKKKYKLQSLKETLYLCIKEFYKYIDLNLLKKYTEIFTKNTKNKIKDDKANQLTKEIFKEQHNAIEDEKRKLHMKKIKEYLLKNTENITQLIMDKVKENKVKKVRIFIDEEIDMYKKEYSIYLYPYIFAKNDFNILLSNKNIVGLPNTILSSPKKLLIFTTSRKNRYPYLCELSQAIKLDTFFKWLDKTDINNEVYQIRSSNRVLKNIKKIPTNIRTEQKSFEIKNILKITDKEGYVLNNHPIKLEYGDSSLVFWIDKMLYGGALENNLFKDLEKYYLDDNLKGKITGKLRNILFQYRENINESLKNNENNSFSEKMLQILNIMLKEQYKLKDTTIYNLKEKYNFVISLLQYFNKEEVKELGEGKLDKLQKCILEKIDQDNPRCESDDEYFYYAGQLGYYLATLSKAKDKKLTLINPILEAKNIKMLLRNLSLMTKKYKHEISMYGYGERFSRVYSMLIDYEIGREVIKDQDNLIIQLGALSKNLIYKNETNDNKSS